MKYVNDVGQVASVNSCPQPGFAERALPDDHPEILEFERLIKVHLTPDERADRDMNSPTIKAMLAAVNQDSAAVARVRNALMLAYEEQQPLNVAARTVGML